MERALDVAQPLDRGGSGQQSDARLPLERAGQCGGEVWHGSGQQKRCNGDLERHAVRVDLLKFSLCAKGKKVIYIYLTTAKKQINSWPLESLSRSSRPWPPSSSRLVFRRRRAIGCGAVGGLAQYRRLESRLRSPVFQRQGRSARLTEEGARVADLGREALRQWRVICEEFGKPALLHRTLRMGITEIAARYRRRFVIAFRTSFPWVQAAGSQRHGLRAGGKGPARPAWLVMVSDATDRSGVTVLPLGLMKCGWYCRHDFPAPRRTLPWRS
ncbi:hypothetical protein WJ972_20175 [Achromobacter insuavis]